MNTALHVILLEKMLEIDVLVLHFLPIILRYDFDQIKQIEDVLTTHIQVNTHIYFNLDFLLLCKQLICLREEK